MASRSLGTLTLDLVAKVGGFTSGMTAAERAADKSLSAIEKRAYQFGQTLGKGLKLAAGVAVAGITALAASLQVTINGLDELSKSAQKVGITTEELSKLAYAGELADVSLETLVGSLGKLTKAQAAALDTSSKQARVFEALGIAVKDAEGNLRSSSDVLGDFAEKFQQLGGSPEAIAAGFQIFGKSFQELIPLLKDGREGIEGAADELERFGGVISTDAGKAAEEFNDNLSRLKVQFQAIFAQVAQQLLPTLVQLSKDLSETAKNGNLAANAVTLITAAVDLGVGALKLYQAAVDNISIAIEQAVKSYEGWVEVTKNVASLGFADGGVVEGFQKITEAADEAAAARTRLASIRNTPAIEAAQGIDFSQGAPLSPDEMAAQNKRLQAALGGVTKAKKEKTEATKKETEADKAFRENILEVNELIDEIARDTQSDLFQNRQRRQEDFEALIGDIQTQNDLLGQTVEMQDLINTARQYGIDLASEEGRVLTETLATYHENRKAIEDQISAMDGLREASLAFLNDVKEGKGVWDSLTDAVNNFADTLFNLAASNVIEQLFGQTGSTSGGSSGNWISALAGAFFGGGRANGGPVEANGLYRVNERGPELLTVGNRDYLMMGGQSGSVTPNRGGGGLTQVNNFNYAAPYSPATEEQKNARLGFETKQALRRNGG
jgi:hypothetical protein